MPKLPRLNATEAESLLLKSGFVLLRSKGSHRIYAKDSRRFVILFHTGRVLHPKIVRDLLSVVEQAEELNHRET